MYKLRGNADFILFDNFSCPFQYSTTIFIYFLSHEPKTTSFRWIDMPCYCMIAVGYRTALIYACALWTCRSVLVFSISEMFRIFGTHSCTATSHIRRRPLICWELKTTYVAETHKSKCAHSLVHICREQTMCEVDCVCFGSKRHPHQ